MGALEIYVYRLTANVTHIVRRDYGQTQDVKSELHFQHDV